MELGDNFCDEASFFARVVVIARELEVGGVDSTAKMWAGRDGWWTNDMWVFLTALMIVDEVVDFHESFLKRYIKKEEEE